MSLFEEATAILIAVRDLSYPQDMFQWDGSWFGHPGTELIDQYAGTPLYREMIDAGFSSASIVKHFQSDAEAFSTTRQDVIMYPDDV